LLGWGEPSLIRDLTHSFAIELKPQMGDDFPSVLRQMKRNNANVLVVGEFNSSICSLEEVRSMFATSGKKIVTLGEPHPRTT